MRVLRYTILAIALILWGAGLSTTVARWLYSIGVIIDDYRYGDLYRIAPLPQFKLSQPTCPSSNRSSDTSSTHLYIIGDSFTEPQRLTKSDFRVSHFQRVAWSYSLPVQLDPGKRNVLLIESVERHVREHFRQPVTELVVQSDTTRLSHEQPALYKRIYDDFHRSDVEERLESALFSQDWAFWFKELKAKLTLDWFNRAYTSVSLSNNHKHVFLHSDTDTTKAKALNSSFSFVTDQEVNAVVDSINANADRYRKLGFNEVYLSLIPNKASILEPDRGVYNHLIERIQNNTRLRIPTVNTYQPFSQHPTGMYLKSDTHWTCDGRAIWLNLVRQKLRI
ncbi:hypothetical protein [Spirosoma sp. KNUC1025]|uniref:hypothetical protein n=1 Tax=Spirosoma sp. KNUC1025 TaxID=2894082 RepID=UPI00386E2E07|nr:hypothetical protein LN737_16340 [Spirosoma sp. KNUC1025]